MSLSELYVIFPMSDLIILYHLHLPSSNCQALTAWYTLITYIHHMQHHAHYQAWQCTMLYIIFFSLPSFLSFTHFLLSFYPPTHNIFYYSKHTFFFLTHITSLNTALLLFSHTLVSLTPVSSTYLYHSYPISFSYLTPPTSHTFSYLFKFSLSYPLSHFLYSLPPYCPTSYSHITHLFILYQFPTSCSLTIISFTFLPHFTITSTNSTHFHLLR